jgi:hypothetical protein
VALLSPSSGDENVAMRAWEGAAACTAEAMVTDAEIADRAPSRAAILFNPIAARAGCYGFDCQARQSSF